VGGGGSIFSSLTVVLFSLPSLSFYVRHFYRFLRFTTKQFPQTTLFAQKEREKEREKKVDFFFSV